MDGLVDNWSLIGDSYYIKYHFYNMKWKININNFNDYLFACETFGGPIAAIAKSSSNQELMVFSPSGVLLSSLVWKDAPVIGIYWSENENIFLLQKSGRIAIHDLNCNYIKYVGMGDTIKQHNIKSFRFFSTLQGTGLMIWTEYNEIFYKTNLMNTDSVIKPLKYFKQLPINTITDWVAFTDLIDKEIVAIFIEKNVLIKLKYDQEPQKCNQGNNWRIIKMSLTMSKQKIAIATNNGKVSIMKSDLSQTISSCNFEFLVNDDDNIQMEWAGEDLLVLYYQNSIYLLDTKSQSTSNLYLGEPIMFPEIDGVRLVTATRNDFIQKVPQQLEQIYLVSSESPAMLLFEAQQHLDNKKSEAVTFLELLLSKKGQMQEAIDICLAAAAHCLEPKWQKVILRSVRLGRSYVPDYRSDTVEDIHKKLLLLNNLKLPYVAVPITMNQLENMTLEVLLDRLINRRYYPFVERICLYLRIPKDLGVNKMVEYWANKYIERSEEEYLLASRIIERLKDHCGFDYAKIASKACDLKKFVLAEKLLDREGKVHDQVKILLKLNKYNIALNRSIESGDSDLISLVVSELFSKLNYCDFITMIHKNPIAKTMYLENLLNPSNPEADKSKRSLDELDDNLYMKTEVQLKKVFEAETFQTALSAINGCQDLYKKAGNEFMTQIMDDEKVLIQSLTTSFKSSDVDVNMGCNMSIHDYLTLLFKNNLYDRAESFKQKMRISDRQFYWLKLNICAKTDNWEEFNATILKWNRKMPVTFYDVGEICADCNNEVYLNKYMDKIEPDKRVRLLVKINKLQEAEDLARLIKNEYLIHYVTALKI